MTPTRVAIVGGGCAAMAAAYELTAPQLAGQFEVTVYQQGFRLGGKGASGRGPNGRIEEHGLHVWMGFYENAFRMLRSVYQELGRDPATSPIAHFEEAFAPAPHVGLTDWAPRSDWTVWSAIFPALPGEPGEPRPDDSAPRTVLDYFARAATVIPTLFRVAYGPQLETYAPLLPTSLAGWIERTEELARTAVGMGASLLTLFQHQCQALLALSGGIAPTPLLAGWNHAIGVLLEAMRLSLRVLLPHADRDERRARAAEVLEVLLVAQLGTWRAGVLLHPAGFDKLDDLEFCDFLRQNGASNEAVCSSFVRGLYSLMFAYEDGDYRRPRVAAGQALRGCLRMFFAYRGAFFWKMTAGMGDIVFAPLYEVLRARGVRFEFFHRLTNVGLGPQGEPAHVRSLDFAVQATPKGGVYAPLVDVRGVPSWPAQPLWDQLERGQELAAEGRDFESAWERRVEGTKQLLVQRDFDFVVLGVSVAAVPEVCSEILRRDARWRAMCTQLKTVATQAMQLWTSASLEELGWRHGTITLTGFVSPFDTWADMTHLLRVEDWPAHAPATVAYFCNVLDERELVAADPGSPGFEQRVFESVREQSTTFIRESLHRLWPELGAGDHVDWSMLHDSRAIPGQGPGRLEAQYLRANVNPTDRYVLCLPGTPRYRISPLDRSYDNLTICGDWTSCGLNLGCVEAAVMSGMLAAHALSGTHPRLESIIGYDHP